MNEDREFAETRWSDALSAGGPPRTWGGVRFGSRLVDSRTATVDVPPDQAFAPIRRIGGRTGWYYGDWLWSLRGFLDLLCGGVGVRRGRRDPEDLRVGDALDFWRVELYEPPHRLRLYAEMKLPGRAWLEFEVTGERTRQYDSPDGHLRSDRFVRFAVLVRHLSLASVRLCRDAAEPGPRGSVPARIVAEGGMMKVKICPQCGQAFSTTAAGLELLYSHLIQEHQLTAEAAGDAVDLATIEDRPEILPVPLPRCS